MREGIYNELVFRNRKQGTCKKSKLSVLMVVAIVAILPLAVGDASLNIGTNAKSVTLDAPHFDDTALKPDWVVDDSWTYHVTTFDFEVVVDLLTIHIENGEIDDLNVAVDEVQSDNYKITFDSSDVSGWVSGLVLWWGNLYQTTFSGEAFIRKSDLAIMDLTVHMEGYIKKPIGTKRWFELDMEIDITDGYDASHFPIVSGESWVVDSAPISVYSSFYLYGLYDADKTTYSSIEEHTSTCTEVVTVSVEAGSFEAFHIESELGTSSDSYYAPSAFNTVKNIGVNIQDANQIFSLNDVEIELKSLSLQNHPPYPPNTPSGPQSGYRYISYAYSTSAIDPDGDQVQYKFDWGDGTQSSWTNLVNSGQSASKSHLWNDLGSFIVRAKTKDEHGIESKDWSDYLMVTIQNHQPIANDDTAVVDEDSSNNEIDVLVNDYDEDGDELEITGVTDPTHGNASYSADYVYYTPDSYYCGSDSIQYSISDGYGGVDLAYLNITIICINDPPVANDDSYEVDEDDTLIVPIDEGVLVNDSDIDGPDPLTANLVDSVAYGTLNLNDDGSFDYTPNPDYYGIDSFTYQAYDGEDYSNVATVTITVNPVNDPPNPPSNPSPPDGATDVDVNVTLSWTCSDPDGDPLTYDVYFGTNPSPPLVSSGQSQNYYDPPGQLQFNTHYYWQIVAWDTYGESTTGPVWDFITGDDEPNDPPNPPSDPIPQDGATEVNIEADLSWTCSDPNGDDLVYDVYFEADDPDPDVLVSDDQTETIFDPGTLQFETVYYWQIVAKDEHGESTSGPVWHFTTEEAENQPPNAPTINGKTSGNAGTEYEYSFKSIDPDNDDIAEYIVNWDDGTGEETITGPFASGDKAFASHTWVEQGDYVITAKAKDVNGLEGTEGALSISMPRDRAITNSLLLRFLERLEGLLERFPNAFPILRYILGL